VSARAAPGSFPPLAAGAPSRHDFAIAYATYRLVREEPPMDLSKILEIGRIFHFAPVPHIAENTTLFPAGVISFGVEYRNLTDEIAEQHYGKDGTDQLRKEVGYDAPVGQLSENGVSIHVFGDDGREYLRFDCFDDEPHYHYLKPDEPVQRVVALDTFANGDPLKWALASLRARLGPMLREAGGAAYVARLDSALVGAAIDRVEHAAKTAIAAAKAAA
jgi:hypothetical protein